MDRTKILSYSEWRKEAQAHPLSTDDDLLFWSVFQIFTVASEDAEMVFEPFWAMATELTAAMWPFISWRHFAVGTYQYLYTEKHVTCVMFT